MRIRVQILAVVATSLVAGIVSLAVVLVAARQSDAAGEAQRRAQMTTHGVAGLLTLTQEYARHAEVRAAQQWHARHAVIASALSEGSGDAIGTVALAQLRSAVGELPPLFSKLESLPPGTDAFSVRRKGMLVDQLLSSTQAMSDYADQWFIDASNVKAKADEQFRIVAFFVPAMLMLALCGVALVVRQRVLVPLKRLDAATRALAAGDMGHRLGSTERGELGELARQFDLMSARLAESSLRLQTSEGQLRAITDNVPALIAYLNREHRYEFANQRYLDWWHIDPATMAGRHVREVLGEAVYNSGKAHFDAALAGQRIRWTNTVQVGGSPRHYQVEYIPDVAPDGSVRGCYAMSIDITALKEAQIEQARTEARLRAITDNLPVLISYLDHEERYRFVNETLREWLGVDPPSAIGRAQAELWPAEHHARVQPFLQRALKGERVTFESELTLRGTTRSLQSTYIPDIQPDGRVAGVYALSTDVSALKRVERQLSELVRVDTLTGLANRYQFNEVLPAALRRGERNRCGVAVMFLDVDRFKEINDTHGHLVGDQVLQHFAERLRRCIRVTDTVARLAGDEFVILLEGLHAASEPERVAQKVIAGMLQPLELDDGRRLQVSTSMGVAYWAPGGAAPGAVELMASADAALYAAKRAGRNTYRFAREAA